MKKSRLEHVLRSAVRITKANEFIIIGSQSLHGKHPDVADEILVLHEVDLMVKKEVGKTEFLNAIGTDSQGVKVMINSGGTRRQDCSQQISVRPISVIDLHWRHQFGRRYGQVCCQNELQAWL